MSYFSLRNSFLMLRCFFPVLGLKQFQFYSGIHLIIKSRTFYKFSSCVIHSPYNRYHHTFSVLNIPIRSYSPHPPAHPLHLSCSGCGSRFQSTNSKLPGFIDEKGFETINTTVEHSLVCKRCCKLRNQESPTDLSQSHHKFAQILRSLDLSNSIVLLVIDLLIFPVGVYPHWHKLIPAFTPIILLLNKVDLVDDAVAGSEKEWEPRVKRSVLKYFNNGPLKDREISRVDFISGLKGMGVQNMARMCSSTYKGRNIYIFGCTNSGKSTLFNRLQRDLWLIESPNPTATPNVFKMSTVSRLPGTTLANISVPIPIQKDLQRVTGTIEMYKEGITEDYVHPVTTNDIRLLSSVRSKLYDSPGVDHELQLLSFLNLKEQAFVVPDKMIRRRTFNFVSGETLLIGGLAKVYFMHKTSSSEIRLHVFCSHKIPLFVIKRNKLDSFLKKYRYSSLKVPQSLEERGSSFPDLVGKELTIEGLHLPLRSLDIVLSDLGWINLHMPLNQSCTIKVYTPKGRGIVTREPLFPKSYLFKSNR